MTRTPRRPLRVSPRCARAAIARAYIGAQQTVTIGSVRLFPHQCDAVRRLRRALHERHIALLADDVGLGKTFVALALAREYPAAHIIVPAALRAMWRAAIERTGVTGTTLHSLQQFSRASSARVVVPVNALVIVDEAHHLRTAATRRYRAIADMVVGRDLLLLSATPIHNSPADLRSLFALANSASARELSTEQLANVIVRRTDFDAHARSSSHDGKDATAPRASAARPTIRSHPPFVTPHDPALLEAILALPAPLPAHDGAVAGALIRLGLLRAWCSSDAALAHSLRRRLLRGEALRHALAAGRHPTNTELRTWIVGSDEVQLAFPELMANTRVETGPLVHVLDRHLRAVRALAMQQASCFQADAERTRIMRRIVATHSGTPIIAFSQFAETVRAVGRALSDIAGVGVITGQHARIASGDISRQDALSSFAPDAQGRPPPPAHQRIRLLLSTDLLAEGVNLQDAGVVIHLDLPWTDALRRQRVGRVVRVGSPHAEVDVYQIEPPAGGEQALRLHERLRAKAAMSRQFVGVPDASAVSRAISARTSSAAECATAVRAGVTTWLTNPAGEDDSIILQTRIPVACALTHMRGFLAVVNHSAAPDAAHDRDDSSSTLIGGVWRTSRSGAARLVVDSAPDRLEALITSANSDVSVRVRRSEWRQVRRAIARWHRLAHLRATLGRSEESATPEHLRVRALLARRFAHTSLADRVRCRSDYLQALSMTERVRGAGAERALREWSGAARDIASAASFAEWLVAWRQFPALQVSESDQSAPVSPLTIHAVLLLETPNTAASSISFD